MPSGRAGHFEGLDALIKQEKTAAKGLADLARAARQAAASAESAFRSAAASTPSAPSVATSGSKSSGSGGSELDPSLLATRIASAFRSAEAPMHAFASDITTMFDRLAGTMIEGFRRFDSSAKFPAFDKAITGIAGRIYRVGDGILSWALKVAPAKEKAQGLEQTVAKLGESVDRLVEHLGAAPAQVAKLAAGFEDATKRAGLLKRTWEAIKAQAPGPLPSSFVPPAGKRPGVGRAIPLDGDPGPYKVPSPGGKPRYDATAVDKGQAQDAEFVFETIAKSAGEMATAVENAFKRITTPATMTGAILRGVFLGAAKFPIAFAGAMTDLGSRFVRLGQSVFRTNHFFSSLGDVAGKTFSQIFKGSLGAANAVKAVGASLLKVGTLGAYKSVASSAKGVAGGMKMAKTSTDNFAGSVRRLGAEALAAFGIFGMVYKTVQFFRDGVKGASDLNEAVSANQTTFGKFADAVSGQADRMAKDYGLNKREQLEIAGGFGEMAQGAGMAQGASAKFANTFTSLAADLSSFKNLPFADAARDIQSALAGQTEPLRKFGVMIDADAVKAYAYAHGLATVGKELSNSAEMAARAALIQNGLASATGDLARTSDSAANQFRKAGGGLDNFGVAIGQVLLPAVQSGAQAFNELLATVVEVFEANKPLIESWAGAVKTAFDGVGMFARNAGSFFTVFRLKAYEAVVNVGEVLATLPANLAIIAEYVANNWYQLIVDALNATATAFQNFVGNLHNLGTAIGTFLADPTQGFQFEWTPLLKGFEATAAQLPELIKPHLSSMQAEIDKEMSKVAEREQARADKVKAKAEEVKRAPADELGDKGKTKKKKKDGDEFAELAEAGSKEAYSAIVRHQFGSRDDGMKVVAREAPRQTEFLRQIARNGVRPSGLDKTLFEVLPG